MDLLAPMDTDWFTFVFWEVRKSRLQKGEGFSSRAIHLVRGQPTSTIGEASTLAEVLGSPMRVALRVDPGPDPLAPVPFGLIALNRVLGLLPVYELTARWPSADVALRDLHDAFGTPRDASWTGVHEASVLTRLATQGMGAHLLQRRDDGGFEIDLLRMARYPVRPPYEPYGARLFLSPSLVPEAIERDGVVARPGDPLWERFMLAFEASLAAWTTPVDHSLTCHFAMAGAMVSALRLALPEGHPLRDALTPFTFATSAVNGSGVFSLLAENAYFSRVFAFTHEGLCELLNDAAAELRFQTFPERLAAQGLTGALDALPFAADGLLWWHALDRFSEALLERWADPADPAVQRFVETWFELHPSARFAATDARAALRRLLPVTLFWITVMHEHVGDVVWYVQDPTWMPVKIRPGDAAAQGLVKQEMVEKMILGVLTAEIEMPRILDDLSHVWADPEMRRVWSVLQAELRGVGAEIGTRNQRRALPYTGLTPERIHISVSL